ncbi:MULTISPECIES: ribonuclease E/G [unclassified Ruegeria]|uniref:Rne/Rng family ribonuclease n=1 Tax=unclassified Ruegeria TaxID=2625375 RepID=UPI001487B8AE|nr:MULTISPECIES: Rne/Rng family ribonuclease [unclassified Ruegeria]NOD87284.1 Rne/Rng family ribonuclease [Ruegeria sp. HKCCD4318]NOE12839.1 Rne/Rng family ribonuclease [Ruegeria sp. HKCCD4318-2]NOG08994.1 Rne/Rng family ribonuclease [Ruegeria sp. HKCCD4315]
MAKKMLIDATHAEETRVVVVDGNKVEEFDFESENKRQLAGNIYLAKVTRVEPSLQAAFVDYGGNRHGFLAFSEIHPDYYQIPVADREALMEEERAYAEAMKARDEAEEAKPKKRRSRSRSKAADVKSDDPVETMEVSTEPTGMETIDLADGEDADAEVPEGTSPMEIVAETPVEEPEDSDATSAETASDNAAEESASEVEDTSASPEEAGDDTGEVSKDAGEASSDETEVSAEADSASANEAGTEAVASDDVETSGEAAADADGDQGAEDEDAEGKSADASSKDDSIESVADEDDSEDIRPPRKPRPRRYKIQEVIKVRQVLLVQVVKEERGNKGAALTTYLSLAGRYCVLMPNTARGGGISRKITNAADRKKLKEIAADIDVPTGAGLIIRTAGAKRTKSEIKRDYEYLQRLWEQIRALTLESIAPAKIYEEGDLIKRSIRDLYNRDIDEVLVEGEGGYRIAKDFMKMIMPSHAKNVKRYEDALPLFARYQVESYLAGMFNPTVQLKSGGYIVIGVTEALVAIDVNSGRATKEGSIEETALKTNLEAAEEVARQLRLRDLAGLIVIDFIDMDERKNNAAVEKRLKDKLKTDRARIQVGRISGFGLLEMSRQRLRPGMIEATTQPCPACHGTGLIRSDDNMALSILRQIEEEGTRRRSREVLVRCPVSIANFLMNQKREHIAQIEARYGLSVRIEGDIHLVSPDFSMEKFKTASRIVPEATAPVVSVDASLMDMVDSSDEEEVEEETTPTEDDAKPKRKRRRRRRKKGGGNGDAAEQSNESSEGEAQENASGDAADEEGAADVVEAEAAEEEKPAKPKRKRAPRRRKKDVAAEETVEQAEATEGVEAETVAEAPVAEDAAENPEAEVPEVAQEQGETVEVEAETVEVAPEEPVNAEEASVEDAPAEETSGVVEELAAQAVEEVTADEVEPAVEAPVEETPEPVLETVAEEPEPGPAKPKRRGWWSLGK